MLRKSLWIALCAASLALGNAPPLQAQEKEPKAAQPAPQPAAGKRTAEDVQQDLGKGSAQLRDLLQDPAVFHDAARRTETAPKAVPVLKQMLAAFDELAQLQPADKPEAAAAIKADLAAAKVEFLTMLSLFGDAPAAADLDKLAKADSAPQATTARAAQQLVTYWQNSKDEAAQLKAIAEMQKLAKASPTDNALAQTLIKMSEMGAASPAVRAKAEDVLLTDLTGGLAKEAGPFIKGMRKQRDSVGKPVELTGTTLDGKSFTTKDWKGKVILVDFWATWCPPCIEELPQIKRAYLDHHAKGLEILGVSSDAELPDLKAFLDKNKDMPWPQLVAKNLGEGLHPLAQEWGIRGIPTLFLIDRKGILRSTEARADFKELIPKLLEEKAE